VADLHGDGLPPVRRTGDRTCRGEQFGTARVRFRRRPIRFCKSVVVVDDRVPKSSPLSGVEVTQILVVTDTQRSTAFWTEVLGAEVYRQYESSVVLRFGGSWVLLVTGGGPTPDKPLVTFAPPAEPDRVSHAMTLRVDDCKAAYEALKERGAEFLTPPYSWGGEVRCFLRDPDGHLIELSEVD
jgi:catechol 2,3-dioxygenase-like lactoylglutathione lyase family enzyme